jgi:hypothetical protein
MKKSILIIALALISASTFAQSDTTKKAIQPVKAKAEFKPKVDSLRNFVLTADQISLLVMTPEEWKNFEWSKYQGEQIQLAKQSATDARKFLSDQLNKSIESEKAKYLQPAPLITNKKANK